MMDIRNEWYDAVFARRSRRQFDGRPLDPAHLRRIEEVCEGFRPWPAVRSVLVAERPDAILTGAIGSYGKVKGAAAYVAFIGDMDSPTVQESVGYMGEGVILEATTLGVGTCWIGGYFKPEAVAAQVGTGTGERVLAVTPLGYTPEAWTLEERLMVALAGSARRKLVGGHIPRPCPVGMAQPRLGSRTPCALGRQPPALAVCFRGGGRSGGGGRLGVALGPHLPPPGLRHCHAALRTGGPARGQDRHLDPSVGAACGEV